jgi:hypothetical protein
MPSKLENIVESPTELFEILKQLEEGNLRVS